MDNQKLYILTGLPYSGKSTLTRELVKRFKYSVVSIDKIMDKHNMWRKGHPTMKDWENAYTEGFETLNDLLLSGKTVIWDGGCLKFDERQSLRDTAENIGVEAVVIYVNTPVKEIIERKKRNEVTKERGQLDEKTMQTALDMFEEPKEDEKHITYNANVDLSSWINEFINIYC